MHKLTQNLPIWRDCDVDWEKGFEEFLAENKTLAYMMLKNVKIFKDKVILTQKNVKGEWESLTWTEFGERITALAKALIDMGIQPGDMCSVFARNCSEWAVSDLGILATRAVSVPIYATNSKEEAEYIINDAEVKVVFVGDQEQYDRAGKIIGDNQYLQFIVAMQDNIKISGDKSTYLSKLIEKGKKLKNDKDFEDRLNNVHPDDIVTLIYTSGTTGNPKGAVHTHRSFLTGIFPSLRYPEAGPDYTSLSILPLSHVFERLWSYGCMSVGVRIGYCPNPADFVEYMNHFKPQFMTSVPRIWDKVYGMIHAGMKSAGGMKYKMFEWAKGVGLEAYRKDSYGLKYKIADKLVFSKIRAMLGAENCNIYHIGGSAFAPDVNEFFQAVGINIAMGYGLTEFFPVCVGFRDNAIPGYCGCILSMTEVRISDEGEVQLKGGMCMSEYYKNPAATKEIFTEDGWFKTQDVGELHYVEKNGDRLGYIKITDRIKELIITAGGKNISPQQIESLLGQEVMISQFVCIGENRKFISALVIPNFELLEDYCKKNNIEYTSPEQIIQNPAIYKLYEKLIADKTRSLGQVEKIKKFVLLPQELTQEAGELTPTLKLKRKFIDQKYKSLIDKLYAE
ncbi:MAG: long-chain fatty acid--CoA ligase [Syntrophomonadaceae bacterium]|nr:long-chain fatty acid--CoA ligase [Syntrophomonadaceae bacterium]